MLDFFMLMLEITSSKVIHNPCMQIAINFFKKLKLGS